MNEIKIAQVYAKAIYDMSIEKNIVEETLEILNILSVAINSEKQIQTILVDPIISIEEKKKILEKIIGKNEDFLNYLVDKDRISKIIEIREEYLNLYHRDKNEIRVIAIFPKEINEEQKQKLITNLEKRENKKVLLEIKVDETLIAGGILKINDEIIDSSIKSQIKDFKEMF